MEDASALSNQGAELIAGTYQAIGGIVGFV
jgi:hypothetical protein